MQGQATEILFLLRQRRILFFFLVRWYAPSRAQRDADPFVRPDYAKPRVIRGEASVAMARRGRADGRGHMSRATLCEGFPQASVLRQGSPLGVRVSSLGGLFSVRLAEIGFGLHSREPACTYVSAHVPSCAKPRATTLVSRSPCDVGRPEAGYGRDY